jgi:hypothetical protein
VSKIVVSFPQDGVHAANKFVAYGIAKRADVMPPFTVTLTNTDTGATTTLTAELHRMTDPGAHPAYYWRCLFGDQKDSGPYTLQVQDAGVALSDTISFPVDDPDFGPVTISAPPPPAKVCPNFTANGTDSDPTASTISYTLSNPTIKITSGSGIPIDANDNWLIDFVNITAAGPYTLTVTDNNGAHDSSTFNPGGRPCGG